MIKDYAQKLFSSADITINGTRPWDIQVHDTRFYRRVFFHGSLGLGESYMDGWWDCKALDQFIEKLLHAGLERKRILRIDLTFGFLRSRLFNLQRKSRAFQIGERHYDIGNRLYAKMLGKSMAYSCGYWRDAKTLDQAQEAKFALICRKLMLKPGMRVLDIGCGWGGLAEYMVRHYKVEVVGITVSQEQLVFATERCKGLAVCFRFQDYRDLHETFDRVVSVGMFEHVGSQNYREYMEVVCRCLKEDGLFLLHTIGGNRSTRSFDPWLEKYIFPNSQLPSIKQIAEAAEGLFVVEDWHNFGLDYDKTLLEWFRNFDLHWNALKKTGGYDERFYRMWKYYLLSCAGSFRARSNQLWQVVFSKGLSGSYAPTR